MAKPKVLLFEKIHRKGIEYLEKEGCEILFPEAITEEALLKVAPVAEGIVFRTRGYLSRRLMEAAPNLKVVGRHGVGLDNLDMEAATELGIWVVSTPEANSQSVAELVLLLALSLARQAPQTVRALKEHRWEDRNRYVGQEILGKTDRHCWFGPRRVIDRPHLAPCLRLPCSVSRYCSEARMGAGTRRPARVAG